jgi:dTDP-4-dehydrorhamnose reductase
MTMRVLILGGGGMLGHKLVEILESNTDSELHFSVRGRHPEAGFARTRATSHEGINLDRGAAQLATLLRKLSPDVVVNAVGAIKQKDLANVFDETLFLNGNLPHALALLNPNRAGNIIHFSTDCVFIGNRGHYTEAERPDAEDLYGRSKAIGEIDYGRHLTIRTSIIGFELGSHLGLLSWLFRQPPGSKLRGYTNAIFSGLPTVTLSRTVRDLLLHHPNISGLYHVASKPISKYDLLRRISDRFDLGHTFTPDPSIRIDRSLDDSRFRALTGTTTPGWDALIEELWQDYQSGPYDRIYRQLRSQT